MAQQTFEEIVDAVMQAESRGKRYAADGKTLTTSPKGALGEMQVMPKTSRDPGFGVTPARDKSPDEIARVGKDYLQAMLGKYGDTEKALIAYNWGPGVTDKWLAAGANPEKLPAETRTYVQRVKTLLGGKDVPRETSVAKKEREPLPPSLPPMAQADIKSNVKPEAAARVASLGPGYQAALALSFLAETDDEEDRKTTITQEYLAKAQDEEDDRVAAEAVSKRQSNVFADLSNTTIRSPFAEPQQPVRMKDGGEVEDLTKPSFGNPNIRKQGEAARRLAAMRDVNTLPDPKTYAVASGLLGTRPDQMGFSVLNPKYKEIMDVANPAFYAGTALQIAPVAQGPGMGRMVGAAERALEPAVRRTLEGGGKASEMLQALAAPPSQMFVRARPEAAARHADLQAQGLSPEQIRAQNLTLVDNRGNLLEEISDAPSVLKQKTASVQRLYYDMLKHPELESIYPGYDMPFVQIGTTRRKDAPLASASFDEREGIRGTVRDLPGDDVRNTVRGTLLHEGQHAIQSIEGFTEGANPSAFVAYIKAQRGTYHSDPTVNENVIREMERAYPNLPEVTDRIGQDLKTRYGKVFPSDRRVGEALYRHMPGEVQADLARIRGNLTAEELKTTPLEASMQQLNINPANILQMSKSGSRPDRQIGDLEYDVYGYANGGPVYRADGSPKEGERKLDPETIRILRNEGTSPASLKRVDPPLELNPSAAGLPGLMMYNDPSLTRTTTSGYILDGSDDKKNFGMAQAMFLNPSKGERADTVAHETEHLLARQNLGSGANVNSKFDELIGDKGNSRLKFVRKAVELAPYLEEKYNIKNAYFDPKMLEFQSKFGIGKNLLYEQLASLSAAEQRLKVDLTKDPELRKTLFSRPDVRETYNALTGLRQTRLDPRDLPPHTRVPEPGMLDAVKKVFKRAEGGPVYRADGSPEEGEESMPNEGSITVQEVKAAKDIFPSLPVMEAVYLLRGSQRQSTPQGEMLSGNMGARIPLGKDAEGMMMLAGSRPEGKQDSSKALLAMLNQRMGEGSVGAQMVRPMDAPAGTYAGGVSGSYPVGEGRVMGNVNMMRMPGQDARVTDYGVGYGGKVGPGELSAMIMRQKDGPYSGQIQYRLPIGRAEGSPEEGEVAPRLTMQQIEALAAREAAEREAASTPAFIAQKSGIGRKAGPVSQALQSGQGQIEFLKGMTNVPQNILGAPMDISNMIAGVYGGGVEKPFMGSEYIKEGLRSKGLGFTPSADPTLAAFYGAGDLGSNLVNPAGVTRAGVQAAGKASDLLTNFKAGRAEQPGGMVDLMTGQRVEPPILTPEQQAEQRTVAALFDNIAGVNQEQIAQDVAAGRLPLYAMPHAGPQLTVAQIQAQNIARLPQDAQEQLRLFEEAATRPRPVAIRRQGPAPEIVQPPPATVAITQPATKLPPPPPFVAPPVSAEFPFVGRLDEFAAGMKGPAQKEQLINQVKGKFREQDVARLEAALADLGPKDKVTPAMLQDALANTYPPSRYRSVEIPATSPMYQDVDNVFSQDKQIAGSMNLYLKESPESLALFDNYLAIKNAAQKAFSSNKPEDINLALDSLKNNPLALKVPEVNVLIDRVEEALPTITRFGKMQEELNNVETMLLYPLLYKKNGFDFFPEAHRRTVLIGQGMDPAQYMRSKYDILKQEESKLIEELMQKGSDNLVALGGNPVDVKAFMQRHANDPDSLYQAAGRDDILKEHVKNNVVPINDGVNAALTKVKENIVNVYIKVDEKLQPYTGYAGRHRAVTGGDNMPIGFSRFTEHTVDIDGRQLKGRHVHELQSDLSKDVKNLGPKGGSLEKDQRELDNLLAKETKLTQEQTALATQFNAMPDNDPLTDKIGQNVLALNAEVVKLNQRKNVLEDRILGPKSTEAPFERDIAKRKSIYVLDEPFANFEAAPAVEMQLLIKNAIQSSIRAGQDFVTFPGKESKQAQLYEKLLPNLKQAVKDLGGEKAGFEIKPITLPNPTGDSPTVYGVVWSPETAAKAIEKGVPFNKGGMVERQPNDNRRYM